MARARSASMPPTSSRCSKERVTRHGKPPRRHPAPGWFRVFSKQGILDGFDRHRSRGPKSKIVLWAHNGHVAFEMPPYTNMGSQLQAKYRADYLSLGFVFAAGSFQARGGDASPRLQVFELGPAPVTDVSAAFTRAAKRSASSICAASPPVRSLAGSRPHIRCVNWERRSPARNLSHRINH